MLVYVKPPVQIRSDPQITFTKTDSATKAISEIGSADTHIGNYIL